MIEHVADDPVHERGLYLARIGSPEEWPADVDEPAPHFVAMLALDAAGVPDATVLGFARKLLDQGAVYACVWGPDCKRVHDLIDEAHGEAGLDDVITTWHEDDSLDEALWFALYAAYPADPYIETCASILAVVSGPEEWADQIRARFADPRRLHADVAR